MTGLLQMPALENARILVVRRDNVGDLVCTTPMLHALRKNFPKARIGVLVNVYNAEVLVGNPDVDDVFVYEKIKHVHGVKAKTKAFIEQTCLKWRLHAWHPTVSILAKSVYDRHGLKYLRAISAQRIVGYYGQGELKQPDIALDAKPFADQHEVEFLADLLKPLGVSEPPGPLRIYPPGEIVSDIRHRISAPGMKLAVHVSARDPERQWGIDKWVQLLNQLLALYPDLHLVLLWAPGEEDNPYVGGDDRLAADLIVTVQSPRLHPLPVKTLSELIGAIQVCDGFIGADGGAMHIAAALQKPVVAFFERIPQKWRHWYPWQVQAEVIKSKTDKICSIPVDEVSGAVQKLLERIRHAHEPA